MSGIAGIVHLDGAPAVAGVVERMTKVMAARGPDGIGHWRRGTAAFGHAMLRTTPESLEEAQPLANEDANVVLVMDGRVDNADEMRRNLAGRAGALRDCSDAELVLRAYEAWGEDCVARLVGEFVFVIWDARKRLLFGARDAIGTRHFYYCWDGRRFAFASEIKALLASGTVAPRMNESRLMDYLVPQFDRDEEVRTFYHGIDRLPAGHALRVTRDAFTTFRYWDPGKLTEARFRSLQECSEAFLEQLRVAVRCRLRSIGPVGAMLSGGLDSSSIVGLVRKDFRPCLSQPLKTYSLVLEDRARCTDWTGIQAMLADGWVEPTVIDSSAARGACLRYIDMIATQDEPFGLSGAFTYLLLSEAARRDGCRVLLDGMAGDLLFHSLSRSLAQPLKVARHLPGILAAARRHDLESELRPIARAWITGAVPAPFRAIYRGLRGPAAAAIDGVELLHPRIAHRFLEEKRDRASSLGAPASEQASHARNFTTGMVSFSHEVVGGAALSSGVEPASPFSDRRLVEFAVRMPIEAKLFSGWYKLTLRHAMANILPEEVRWRTNTGQHPGWDFYAKLFEVAARTAPEFWSLPILQGRLAQWVDPQSLAGAWARYESTGDHASGLQIFSLAVLARWLDTHFES